MPFGCQSLKISFESNEGKKAEVISIMFICVYIMFVYISTHMCIYKQLVILTYAEYHLDRPTFQIKIKQNK